MSKTSIESARFKLGISVILVSLLACPTVWGEQLPIIPIKSLKVRQEQIVSQGVLISRPHAIDKKIHNIIDLYKIRSLQDYSSWLSTHIKYQKDVLKDMWSYPDETLIVKRGDCEDFAFLTSAVANVLGYEPHFLALVRPGRAHAICTFKENGYYVWFDNSRLKTSQSRSLPELARHLSSQYDYVTVLELDVQTNRWKVIYKKS